MKKEWRKKLLKDVCILSSDRISIQRLNKTNYISTENMLPNKAGKVDASSIPAFGCVTGFRPNMTLVSNIRPYFRKIYFTEINGGCSNDVLAFIPKENISAKWLFYLLSQDSFFSYVMSGAKGTKMPRGDKTQIMEYSLCLPSEDIQKKIAEILDSIDKKIQTLSNINQNLDWEDYFSICHRISELEEENQNLEEQAQAIFKSWFVDFEPFKDQPFIDSPLGKIPQGWTVGTIGDIAEITSGKRPRARVTNKSTDFSIPLIGASSIMGYTNEVLYDERILVTGRVGTHGIIQRVNYPCWASDNTLILKSNTFGFLYQCLLSVDWKSLNRGSTQPLITQTDLKNINIIIPASKLMKEYEQLVAPFVLTIERNTQQTQALTQLRDTLLPKLMSGEIDVSEMAV